MEWNRAKLKVDTAPETLICFKLKKFMLESINKATGIKTFGLLSIQLISAVGGYVIAILNFASVCFSLFLSIRLLHVASLILC